MQQLLRAPQAPLMFSLVAATGLCLFIFAIAVLMQPASSVVSQERTAELICLQLAFVPERAAAVVLNFSVEERKAITQLLVPGDIGLTWGMGLTLAGLISLLAMRLPGNWLRVGAFIMWAPFVSATFDSIEDIFLFTIVSQFVVDAAAAINPTLTFLASTAATIKFIALIVVTPAFGIAGIVKGLSVDRSISALIVYLLLAFAIISIAPSSYQGIAACF
ncbi:MAG: hypothetical protein QGG65_04090 [Gammaproteobacteria bacterium]|nr:hypothetical protein [Gammaproteobacteria bacterium]MDP7270507.1 hypothetical protein [Gammaproteobacteria bacterium]HJP05749.1 hypothetical protein [Gammaproteobacteria bacterium]